MQAVKTIGDPIESWLDRPGPMEVFPSAASRYGTRRLRAVETVFGVDGPDPCILLVRLPDGKVLANSGRWAHFHRDVRQNLRDRGVVLAPIDDLRAAGVAFPKYVVDWREDVEAIEAQQPGVVTDGSRPRESVGGLLIRSRRTDFLVDISRDGTDPMPFIVKFPRGSHPKTIAEAWGMITPPPAAEAQERGKEVRRVGTACFVPAPKTVIEKPPQALLDRLKSKPLAIGYGIPEGLVRDNGLPGWGMEKRLQAEHEAAYRKFRGDLRRWARDRERLRAYEPGRWLPIVPGDGKGASFRAEEVLRKGLRRVFVRGEVQVNLERPYSIKLPEWHRVFIPDAIPMLPAPGAILRDDATGS